MASEMYSKGLQHFLQGDLQWKAAGHNFKVHFIDNLYTKSSSHEIENDIPSKASRVVSTTGNLASLTASSGKADASSITKTSVGGSSVSDLILWRSTSSTASDWLVAHYDSLSVTGLPLSATSGDITIQWNASSGAFKFAIT